MAEARGFRNSSSCGVENKLKAIKLTARKMEKERFTVVDLGMNERTTPASHLSFHTGQIPIDEKLYSNSPYGKVLINLTLLLLLNTTCVKLAANI